MNKFSPRRLMMVAVMLLVGTQVWAQKEAYRYTIDLNNVVEDKVQVTLETPVVKAGSIEFHMPKVVPGTYAISDFGRFVTDFHAYNAAGEELTVEHPTVNRWKIADATNLAKISYWVDDTWDSDSKPHIFEPGGSNIEAGENFVLNTFGFFGYLDGMKEQPFEVKVLKPAGFYGSTALIAAQSTDGYDVFRTMDYHRLADSPMMYCRPDTAIREVGGADVLVSVYSPNQKVSADAIMAELAEVLAAQKEYLGGQLPVEKYAFIIYLTDGRGSSGGMGALEHSYSSLYFMPESEGVISMMRDVAAHEFFHIVTPLSIHSEEIHYFNYIEPKMSKHLWLYEGVTEYSAGHVQVKYGLMSKADYLNTLRSKITMAGFFKDELPFTEMSAGCLDEHKSQYLNVYQKGALIGAALDIELLSLTNGQFGIQDLMRRLAQDYGVNKPFKDDELFDVITALTKPEIRNFFTTYVEGSKPLDYAAIFAKVGVLYEPLANRKVLSAGRIRVDFNEETGRYRVSDLSNANEFAEKMGYQVGDELLELDGMKFEPGNYEQVVAKFQNREKRKGKAFALVARPDGQGGYSEVKLKSKVVEANMRGMNLLSFDPNATPEQIALRKAWLEPRD